MIPSPMSSADAPGICATCLPLSIRFILAQPCENLRGGVQETPAQTMFPNPYPGWPASSVVCPVGAKSTEVWPEKGRNTLDVEENG